VEQVLRDKGVQALDPYTRSSIIALLEYVHDSRISAFRRILGRFEELLNSSPREEVLQQFLTSNTVLLEPSVQRIRPKVRLGSEFVTDFVMELADEEYVLVEIEPAHFKLFTEAGNPSAQLMHAQRQVEDWREWISENIAYIRQTLPGLHDPMGLVVIGRRRDLSRAHIRSLRRKNTELHRIRIETYDDLLDRARRYIRNLQPDVASND
jgi:thioesterase domain-containing protein